MLSWLNDYKIPVQELSYLSLFKLVSHEKIASITLRGFFSKVAKLAPLLVPVVIGSIVGAEDIISAMELRCFGVGKRTWLTQLHPRQSDRVFITLSILGFATVTTINILGNFYTHGSLHFLHTQGIPPFLVP